MSCWLTMALHTGLLFSTGILFTDLMATFNSSRAETAAIQSTSLAVFLSSGIFTGVLINKSGLAAVGLAFSFGLMVCFFASSLTYLIISVGVFSGFGCSCTYISSATVIGTGFSGKKQFLYMSIVNTGSGIGNMVYPYVIRYLSDKYGFRGALLLVGAISLNTVPGCILWKLKSNANKRPQRTVFNRQITAFQTRLQVKSEENGDKISIEKLQYISSTDGSDFSYVNQYPVLQDKAQTRTVIVQDRGNKSASSYICTSGQTLYKKVKYIIHNKSFMFFAIGTAVSAPCLNLIIIFVADIYQDNGLTSADVSLGLLLLSAMSTVGRVLPGILLHSKRISTLVLPFLTAVVSIALLLFFTFVKSRWLIIFLTGASGIPKGAFVAMLTVVTLKLVGSNALPIAVGMFFTLNGIGQAISGPVNGYIRDVTGSYSTQFYIAAGICFVAAVVFFLAYIIRRKNKHMRRRDSSVFYLTSF